MADKMTLRRYLELYALYARMDFNFVKRDTRVALMAILADCISNIASISGVFMLAYRFDGVGGMSRDEVLLMLGFVTCVTGLYQLFFAGNNNGHLSRRIGRGQIDHMVVMPLPYAAQLLTEGFIPVTGSQNLLFGIGISVWAVKRMGLSPGALWWLMMAAYLIISIAIIVGLSYAFSALAFVRPVAFEEISTTVIDDMTGEISKFPLSGMPTAMQGLLISVIPAGLLGWFPVCAALGSPPLGLSAAYPLFAALVIWIIAAIAIRKGFVYYVKHGIGRYLPYGYRR